MLALPTLSFWVWELTSRRELTLTGRFMSLQVVYFPIRQMVYWYYLAPPSQDPCKAARKTQKICTPPSLVWCKVNEKKIRLDCRKNLQIFNDQLKQVIGNLIISKTWQSMLLDPFFCSKNIFVEKRHQNWVCKLPARLRCTLVKKVWF